MVSFATGTSSIKYLTTRAIPYCSDQSVPFTLTRMPDVHHVRRKRSPTNTMHMVRLLFGDEYDVSAKSLMKMTWLSTIKNPLPSEFDGVSLMVFVRLMVFVCVFSRASFVTVLV